MIGRKTLDHYGERYNQTGPIGKPKMTRTTIASLFLSAIWAGLVWLGTDLMRGVAERSVSGAAANGQIFFYVTIPIIMTLASGILTLANYKYRSKITVYVTPFMYLSIPIYLYTYGGGV